jgi:hypothetical protein
LASYTTGTSGERLERACTTFVLWSCVNLASGSASISPIRLHDEPSRHPRNQHRVAFLGEDLVSNPFFV